MSEASLAVQGITKLQLEMEQKDRELVVNKERSKHNNLLYILLLSLIMYLGELLNRFVSHPVFHLFFNKRFPNLFFIQNRLVFMEFPWQQNPKRYSHPYFWFVIITIRLFDGHDDSITVRRLSSWIVITRRDYVKIKIGKRLLKSKW